MRDDEYPRSRQAAREAGLEFYYTGYVCSHGHQTKRTLSGACYGCIHDPDMMAAKNARRRERIATDPEHRERENQRNRDRWQSPAYREQCARRTRERYNNDPEYRTAVRSYHQAYLDKNPEKREALNARQREAYAKNPEPVLARTSQWAKENRERKNAAWKRYVGKKNDASPQWLTDRQWEEIDRLYDLAVDMSTFSGELHTVDHIIPLRGRTVCGLHVPWNLRILSQSENSKKSNKLPPPEDWLAPTEANGQRSGADDFDLLLAA